MKNNKYTLGLYQFYIVTALFQNKKILQQEIVTGVKEIQHQQLEI